MALPVAPLASVLLEESKLPSELVHAASVQTWKLSVPLSLGSGSLKVALRVGVAVFRRTPSAGETSGG